MLKARVLDAKRPDFELLETMLWRPETGVFLLHRCLLYTSDAADERSSVDLGGRRIIKKKTDVERRGRQ